MKLKKITDTSWIVLKSTDNTRAGVLTKVNSTYVLMEGSTRTSFDDETSVNKFFGVDIFSRVVTNESKPEETLVKGFPTKITTPYLVQAESDLPLFTKTPSSDVYYVAGYFCVKSNSTWKSTMCPKLTTLAEYDSYEGPFKTDMEAKSRLRSLGSITVEEVADES